jgi:DNA-binding XRE family transcriptional regulator
VLFFVLYYIITITGEKFARELIWHPAAGMWLSSFILLPLGIFLSYKATTDSVLMNADFYMESVKKLLGQRIKEIRKSKNLTQPALAELVNVDSKYISRIETGNSYPSLDTLEKLKVGAPDGSVAN